VNFAYTGSADDKGGGSLDRTREGYVEIIEMAVYDPASTVAISVTHVDGVPACAPLNDTIAATEGFNSPQGGLFGGISLVNVGSGTDFTEDAVALDNFSAVPIYFAAGTISPDLTQATPPISQVLAFSQIFTSTWPQTLGPTGNVSADPVSAVLMHDNVLNEFVLDAGTASGTDWVVTFPTKRYYVNVGTGNAPRLFQRNFNGTVGSCDDVSLSLFDREEFNITVVTFSPPPPTNVNSICWEANVLTFQNSNVLASVNIANVPTSFQNGWMDLGFATASTNLVHKLINVTNTTITFINSGVTSGATVTYEGLPVVGFAVQTFKNGNVGGVLSNYGGNFVQKTTTRID